jgi:pimeloyl-ACP methyl ester carboxylesterase
MIWYESEGSGSCTVLLLHGLGATGAVWRGVRRALAAEGRGLRCITPDLSGHGKSDWRAMYSVGQLAADLAPLLEGAGKLFLLGHSLGVYVGLALASRWFGLRVDAVLGLGPKVTWSEAEVAGARDLAMRPVRWHAQEMDVLARYRRIAGLDTAIAPAPEWLERGVTQAPEGFRLSQDPRTFGVAGAPFASLVASADARVLLVRGEHDPMVSLQELRMHRSDARDIAAAGHNAHVEKPGELVALLRQLMPA